MISAFQLIRKWFTSKPREAVPPWHVSVHIVGGVAEDSGEILDSVLRISDGSFHFRFPDQCLAFPSEGTVEIQVPDHTKIDIHTEVHEYE